MSNLSSKLAELARYTAWANDRLYSSLAALPPATISQPHPGRSEGIGGVLGHMQVIGTIWRAHLEGRRHGLRSRTMAVIPPLVELRALQEGTDAWYARYALATSEQQLDEVIDFELVGGKPGRMSRGDILLHVTNHGTYHRGYVATMMYAAGFKPPSMDYNVWCSSAGR